MTAPRARAEAFAAAYPSARARTIATRSAMPLFDGDWIASGTVVCAVGSSRPGTRGLDDRLLQRAATVIVKSRG